jgi:DNA helicase-2/ATP-dependent DNA helicase PcrA
MRLPKFRDLTQAQKDVYLYAPNDTHVLVAGPPGTGKTLIACFRAVELQKRKVPVVLCMFNRVLAKYASNASEGQESSFMVRTARQWFLDWWKHAGLPPCSQGSDILVGASYEQRVAVKAAGARWHKDVWCPWRGKRGAWVVGIDVWSENGHRFSAWSTLQAPPLHPESTTEYDWDTICEHVMDHSDSLSEAAVSPGTLLIDEGQDFAPGFYRFLRVLSAIGPSRGAPHPLKCMVLADENQQLTQFNSTLTDIQAALKIADEHRYQLLDNFRNTREIAELAREFFADVGALPLLPDRRGELPTFVAYGAIPACVKAIMTWVANHPGKETGVLVFKENKRELLHASIKAEAAKMVGRDLTVQTYSWISRADNKVDDLVFDGSDVITVLNTQSCKGLEFDAVFIVDLHDSPIGSIGADRFRMQMFVAVSRARQWVELLASSLVRPDELFLKELPPAQYLRRERPSPVPVVARPARALAAVGTAVASATAAAVPAAAATAEHWEDEARELAKRQGWQCEDLRPKGCFWVYAPERSPAHLPQLGFRYTARRNGWWRT